MERLTISETEVVVAAGFPERPLPDRPERRRVALLTQEAPARHAAEVAAILESDGLLVETIELPDREEAKTLAVAESVYEALARFGFTRFDSVVGVGGGSVTDLAGYVAGTWLRGVEAIHFPTTLLGAVDASIGGKTGVNLAGKNLVGVFWHPSRVVVNTAILEALPTPLLQEGMAEAFKAGLVGDGTLCHLLATHGLSAPLTEVVTRAVRVKANIVDSDVREHGVRAYLNFGHTIGHAIEFASSLSHGESVAAGMVAATEISERTHGFKESALVLSTLDRLGLPTEVGGIDSARVRDLLRHDKKRDGEGLRMVLLEDVAVPVLRHVDAEEVEMGLTAVGL